MKSRQVLLGSLLVALAVGGGTVRGALLEFQIDPVHSSVVFKVKHNGIGFIYGRFNDIAGTLSVDNKKAPTKLEVKATVKTKSVDTNSKKRDKHLKKAEFLHLKKYKEITFEAKECVKLDDNKFELTGSLTLLGETLPLTVLLTITGTKKVEPGRDRIGGESTFTIKRSDFGMGKMLKGIADEVTIIVSIEAERYMPPAG